MKKRKKTAGEQILEGLKEFRDALRRGEKIESRFTVRTVELDLKPLTPREYDARAIKATRERLGLSQAIFAQLLGISLKLVQSWEQGTRIPEVLARHVLDSINRDPQAWLDRLEKAVKHRRKAI